MRPSQKLDLALHFASGVSPAWFFLLIPLAIGLGWLLYHREIKGLPRRRIAVLCVLRLTLLGLVLFAVFMPSLDIVRRLVFPGRIVVLVDNSESMTVSDSTMPATDALSLARSLGADQVRPDDPQTSFHQSSLHLQELLGRVWQFQRELTKHGDDSPRLRKAVRAFQDRSAAVFIELREGQANLPLDSLSPEGRDEHEALQQELSVLQEMTAGLGAEARSSAASPAEVRGALERMIAGYQTLQRKVDEDLLTRDDAALTKLSNDVISTGRLQLANRAVRELAVAAGEWTPGQYLQVMDLMTGGVEVVKPRRRSRAIESARGRTDLRGRLENIIAEPSAFPLTGVVVVSDGLELSDEPADEVLKQYVERRVPIFCAGVGHLEEPHDLAITEVRAPPIGVKDHGFSVEIHVKASVKLPTTGKLFIRKGSETVAEREFELKSEQQIVHVPVTPRTEGLKHYTVELEPAEQDAFEERNNKAAFVLDVRPEKLRVLLLDDRPRWQTRFVINILSRLPYVDANTIIRVVQEEGKLERGQFKGSWPSSSEVLDIYDVVLLGRFESAVLDAAEWRQLEAFVRERGRTLVLLAPGDTAAYPGFIRELFPLPPSPVRAEHRLTRKSLAGLRLTEEGALHPLTRPLQSHLAVAPFPGGAARPGALVLMHEEETRRPVISCRLVGNGKVFMLHSDRLWVCLNRRHLERHANIFINLVEWASRTRSSHVLLDQNTLMEGEAFYAWGSDLGQEISVLDGKGEVAARSKAVPAQNSPGIYRSVFDPLSPGHFSVREEGRERAESLYVLPDNEEVVKLAQCADYLRQLARASGGEYRPLGEIDAFLPAMDLKERAEMHRHVIQLWSSQATLLFLLLLLSIEWILRKYWGLV